MRGIVARRLLTLVPLVWLVVTLTFIVVQAAPGSYADTIDNPRLSPETRAAIRAHYGADKPVLDQYLRWLGAVATGDLGVSFMYREPVTRVLARALPPTVLLAGTGLAITLLLGLVLAVASARKPYGWADRVISFFSLGLYGVPSFWLAGGLIMVFSLRLGWLPPSHMYSVGASDLSTIDSLFDLLRHLVLPAICLGLVGAAGTARYLRATLIDVRSSRFMLAARARGLPEWRLLWVHALRPALLPVVTLFGLSLPILVSGSVVVETIFSWPGMGQVAYNAARARDIPLILGATLVGAVAVILGNLISDVLYAVVDPRARRPQ
ncbi:MAG: ABC transporter permease [Acidobacteriota bacterium]|nr:ABC transporter permease [Acidobacteriota bacterium]